VLGLLGFEASQQLLAHENQEIDGAHHGAELSGQQLDDLVREEWSREAILSTIDAIVSARALSRVGSCERVQLDTHENDA